MRALSPVLHALLIAAFAWLPAAEEEVLVEVAVVVPAEFNESTLYRNLFNPNASRLVLNSTLGNGSSVLGRGSPPSAGNLSTGTLSAGNLSTGNLFTGNLSAAPHSLPEKDTANTPLGAPAVVIMRPPSSFFRLLNVAPILCVIGFDYTCYNDTNVTWIRYDAGDQGSSPPIVLMAVGAVVGGLVVLLLSFWLGVRLGRNKRSSVAHQPGPRVLPPATGVGAHAAPPPHSARICLAHSPDARKPVIPVHIEWPPRAYVENKNPYFQGGAPASLPVFRAYA